MAVVIETTIGDLTVDLFIEERPQACLNFLKLCKLRYYNYNLFHTIEHGFIAQTGDPTGVGNGGESVWGVIEGGQQKRFFQAEYQPKIRHTEPGLLSMVSLGDQLIGAQFFLTLGDNLTSLDETHCVIGQVTEGHDVLRTLNDAICDANHRPYKDIRITHTIILADPFANPRGFREPSRSPSPTPERMRGGRIGADEDIDDTAGKSEQEITEMLQDREAKARATILEIVGDLPDAEMAPPENVLFVCKLNPVTSDEDLEIIFSRFGRVKGCEVIRDRVSGDSLQYAFVEFEDAKTCETAYFKMDNVLIDDRRIHVDFSQSVAKVQWKGKGRGLVLKDGQKNNRLNFSDLKGSKGGDGGGNNRPRQAFDRSRSPQMDHRNRKTWNSERKNGDDNGAARFERNNERPRNDRTDQRAYRNSPERSKNNGSRNRDNIRRERSRSRDGRRHRSRSREQLNQERRERSPLVADRRRQRSQSRGEDHHSRQRRPRSISPRRKLPTTRRSSRSNSREKNRGGRAEKSRKRRSSSSDDEPRKKVKKAKKKSSKKKKSKKSKKASSSDSSSSSSSD